MIWDLPGRKGMHTDAYGIVWDNSLHDRIRRTKQPAAGKKRKTVII